MLRSRLLILFAATLALSGCATLDDLFAGIKKSRSSGEVSLADRPVESPIDANRFVLLSDGQSLVGVPQVVFTTADDTFSDLARTYGLGYDELLAANPGIDPWLPGEGVPVLLPTQFVLPEKIRRGVVLNIATKRLFYFPQPEEGMAQEVLTYPIGIGRVGWETPLGATTVVAKAKDPSWWVPASVRKEHAELGDPLPAVVPPGPDNPLGHRVLKLNMPGYLIHGTNQPYGVGMRVSHGCVRLYPENIEYLYTLVAVGEPVMIINKPYQAGTLDGELYFEVHLPLEDDTVDPDERLRSLIDSQVNEFGEPLDKHLKEQMFELSRSPTGVPVNVAMYDVKEVMARVRVVDNVVVRGENEPTLEEVREMMSEAQAEVEAEVNVGD